MSIKAVIFDMDGTLLDTERLISECMIETAEEEGWALEWDTVIDCIGTTSVETEQIVMDAMGVSFPFAEIKNKSIERFKNITDLKERIFKNGAERLMNCLDGRKIPFAMATSTSRIEVEQILNFLDITHRFQTIVCGDDVVNNKPDPEIYRKTSANLGIMPDEMLVFEDSSNGLKAAVSAGARVVWIPDLQSVNENLRDACYSEIGSLDAACDRLGELLG